jgi:protoporphyrinogen oxidase
MSEVAIIGGGPAGLTAAYFLQKISTDHRPLVLESSTLVGGIARTESHAGFRFDIGGHRFFTKVDEVREIWEEVCGDDFLTRPRQSRIFFNGKFFDYPLKIANTLSQLGIAETSRVLSSYLKWRIFPYKQEDTLQEWVTNRFGERLYSMFFKTYTEKVWGVPCTEIRADWAAQRIKNLSLTKAVWNAVSGANDTASLIEEFQYPRLGPGMMWEKMRDLIIAAGGEVRMQSAVRRVLREGNRVTGIEVVSLDATGQPTETSLVSADHYISSMGLRDLILCLDPPPPPEVVDAALGLKYRDFLIVVLILDHPSPFSDNWIYIHSEDVKVGRIQNFAAWSPEMMANPDQASIGMEYFLNMTDAMWSLPDEALIRMAAQELETIGLAPAASVVDGTVIRQPKAYPVYDAEYQQLLEVIRTWMAGLENLQTVGRNGLHRYNNQDHSMLTAMLAARNIVLGEENDLWEVNVERSYHEEFQTAAKPTLRSAA